MQDRVAVRRGFGDHLFADRAAGAAAVLDGELLAEIVRSTPGIDDARGGVGAAGRRIGHDDPHRPIGPTVLGVRPAGERRRRHGR